VSIIVVASRTAAPAAGRTCRSPSRTCSARPCPVP
jgi:hypothetical protein